MDDLIRRKAAIDALYKMLHDCFWADDEELDAVITTLNELPSAQSSRIEQELHGKTPEEQYEFLYWLLLKFGPAYTDSKLAVVEWLRGEKEDGRSDKQTGGD